MHYLVIKYLIKSWIDIGSLFRQMIFVFFLPSIFWEMISCISIRSFRANITIDGLCWFSLAITNSLIISNSGVARGRAIGQLPNDSKVIAQGFFEMLPIAQCWKILIHMYVRRSKWCYRNTMSLVMIWSSDSEQWTNNLFH